MGACSSKPKTTEFDVSTEPSKKTEDVGADRSIDAVDAPQVSHQNELVTEELGATDAGKEAVQEKQAMQEVRSLIASKDEEPLVKELLSTSEGVSHSVDAESSAVDGEAGDSAGEKVKADVGGARNVDVGDGASDYKEVSEKASTVDEGVGGDQEKLFEDKAVVLDEASNGVVAKGDAYIDKVVAANEEEAHECSDKGSGSATKQVEELRNLQDIDEAPGLESPIIGVVHVAEPIHVDDVSESVGSAMPETTAHVDSKVSESPDEVERDVSTGSNIGEDGMPSTEEAKAANLSPGSPKEAPKEKEDVLHDDSKGSPLLVSNSDDGVGQKSGADDARGEEVPLASADAQDEMSVEEKAEPEAIEDPRNVIEVEPETIEDPRNVIEESTSEPQEESSLEESARESHVEVTENEGNAGVLDEPEPEAPKVHESIDAKTSIEPKSETTLEQAIEGQGEGILDEPKPSEVQLQALAIEDTAEDNKPDATPDETIVEPSVETDKEEKIEKPHIEEATTNELKVESVDAGNLESTVEQVIKVSGEGDLAFEDASDVPLKVESSTIEDASDVPLKVESSTIESGDKPNS